MQAKLIMLVGLPACGKSTYAEQLRRNHPVETKIFSSDSIREELFPGQPYNPENNQIVFNALHKRIVENLKLGKTCIYDATNVNSKKRKQFISQLKKTRCRKECIVIIEDINTLKERDANRKAKVGSEVIEKFWKRFELPIKSEGWDSIIIKVPDYVYENKTSYKNYLHKAKGFDQKSQHHKLDLYQHMKTTRNKARIYGLPILYKYGIKAYRLLIKSAYLHDIGKLYTQTAVNCKGGYDEYFDNGHTYINHHYYGHENVSAYELLLCSEFWYRPRVDDNTRLNKYLSEMDKELKKIDEMKIVVTLVNYHMRLFSNQGSKTYQKQLQKQFSPMLYDMLKVLYKCDRKAH